MAGSPFRTTAPEATLGTASHLVLPHRLTDDIHDRSDDHVGDQNDEPTRQTGAVLVGMLRESERLGGVRNVRLVTPGKGIITLLGFKAWPGRAPAWTFAWALEELNL
jgi:hypothetical protein